MVTKRIARPMAALLTTALLLLAGCSGSKGPETPSGGGSGTSTGSDAVTLPTGYKTAGELYALIAKLPKDQQEKVILEGARKEGKVVLATPSEEEQTRAIGDLFHKRYPFIKMEILSGTHDTVVAKTLTEVRAGKASIDHLSVGPNLFDFRKENATAELHGLLDMPDYPKTFLGKDWYADQMLSLMIAYNTTMVKEADAPKSFEDLLDPKWKGKVSIDTAPDNLIAGMIIKWGEPKTRDWLQRFAVDNQALLRKGHTNQTNLLIAGEFPVSAELYDYRIALMKSQKAPINMVWTDFIVTEQSSNIIINQAPNPYSALLFSQWMLTPEGQDAKGQYGRVMAHPKAKLQFSELQRLTAPENASKLVLLTPENLAEKAEPAAKMIKEIIGARLTSGN